MASRTPSEAQPQSLVRSLWSRGLLLPLSVFAILWLDLIRQLSYTWGTNEQYGYGWFVPLLALGLFAKKWPNRPQAGLLAADRGQPPGGESSAGSSPPFLFSAFCILLCLFLLPLRVVIEINQDWPLTTWAYTGVVVTLTLYALWLAGGWAWVQHFGFSAGFILLAVAWPYRIEHSLTHSLMLLVSTIAVEALNLLGIPALRHGNLIEIASGVVGVDEACSGIRSFQSTIMVTLLLGELYLFRWCWRLFFVVLGLGIAFILNVGRTLFLSWRASSEGLGGVDRWHDTAGFTIVLVCLACLSLLALVFQRKWSGPESSVVGSPPFPVSSPSSAVNSPLIRRYLLAVGCWTILILLGTEFWYRPAAGNRSESARWWLDCPTNAPNFQPIPVSPFAQKLLKYDQGITGAWEEPEGARWSALCFRWREGNPTSRMSALSHRPEYCMTGSGHQMNADLGIKELPANGLSLPFREYVFDAPQSPLYVFFCLWEDGAERQAGFAPTKYQNRFRSVLNRRRGLGQQTLEFICSGYTGIDQARAAVTARLPGLIRTGTSDH